MSAVDLAPYPGAAPASRRVLAHAGTEFRQVMRNGEQLLLALVIPIGVLMLGHLAQDRFGLDPRTFPASVLALALWSTSFTSLAIATAYDRRYGVLERLAATPLGKRGLIAGKALANVGVSLVQLVVLAVIALLLGWRPAAAPLPILLSVVVTLGAVVAFANLGLALAGALRAEVVLALSNTIYLVLAVVGAVLIPLSAYPAALRPLVACLPTAALGESLRAAATGAVLWWPLVSVLIWVPLTTALARKVFRWMS